MRALRFASRRRAQRPLGSRVDGFKFGALNATRRFWTFLLSGFCTWRGAPRTMAENGSEAPRQLSAKEQLLEVQAAETAARQLLLVLEAWPAFVPACLAPLRAEKGADASAVALLRAPPRVISTLAMVCHNNAKAASTAERFKPLLPRVAFVASNQLRAEADGWANADELGAALATPVADDRSALVVVAVELSGGGVHAHAAALRGMDGADAERGPWRYCLDSGANFALEQPRCAPHAGRRPRAHGACGAAPREPRLRPRRRRRPVRIAHAEYPRAPPNRTGPPRRRAQLRLDRGAAPRPRVRTPAAAARVQAQHTRLCEHVRWQWRAAL